MYLGFLRPLYERPGPWVSVYFDATHDAEDSRRAIWVRWRNVRRDLEAQGIDQGTIDALEEAARRPPLDGVRGFALFARDGRVAMTVRMSAPPTRDSGSIAALPHVVPLLATLGEPVPWVRAVVDRTGADITSSTGWREPAGERAEGDQLYPVPRVSAGGWSMPRYQRAAGENWHRNAGEVASAVVRAAERVNADVLVIAGDVFARRLLVDHLPARWASLVTQVDVGSRAAGADPDALDRATAEAIHSAAERRRSVELNNFSARRASGWARYDLEGVVTAARLGQIATLLLPATGIEEPVWIGDAPTDVARSPDALRLGDNAAPPREARADAALVRAIAGTDAKVVFAEDGQLPDGVGAVLRYGL